MHLILRADLDGVGKKGDVVDVADGYARNFLLPKGHAIKASKGAEDQAQAMRRSRDIKDAAARGAAEEVATRLVPTTIKLSAKSGPEGRLFGSIGAAEIASAIVEQTGIDIDRKQLVMVEPIKELGTHTVPAKLHADVEFPVTIEVVTL